MSMGVLLFCLDLQIIFHLNQREIVLGSLLQSLFSCASVMTCPCRGKL